MRLDVGDRYLVGRGGALVRSRPALGGTQHEHRPPRPAAVLGGARVCLNRRDLVQRLVDRVRQFVVHPGRVVAGHLDRVVPEPVQQREQIGVRDARQQCRIGDLVPVQVQDRQHGPIGDRAQKDVGQPAGRQRPGFGLAVADHTRDDQIGVVERGAIGVHQRVPEFPALVDRAGHLGGDVARNPAREGKLAEQLRHARLIAAHRGVQLAVGALEPRVRHDRRAAVARAGHEHHVKVAGDDGPVQMCPQQVQARTGSPVAQQARLDVLGPQTAGEQRVGHQVDLAHRQVVRGPPPGVQRGYVGVAESWHVNLRLRTHGHSHTLIVAR